MRARNVLVLLAVAATVSACGSADSQRGREQPPRTEVGEQPAGRPPPLVLRTQAGTVRLPAWAYCYSRQRGEEVVGSCGDGGPPRPPPRIETDGSASFTFAGEDWRFVAEFRPVGELGAPQCRPRLRTQVGKEGDDYVIPALGPAGVWDVDVSGRSRTDAGNDLITTFRWVTSADSGLVPPAWAAVKFQTPPSARPRQAAYGPDVRLEGLFPEPSTASVMFTVTSEGGETRSFALAQGEDDCAADGLVTFGPSATPEEPDVVGDGPFAYRLDVVLDGTAYVGEASWPDDLESPGNSDVLVTSWEPPLPTGLAGR